MRFTPRRAFPRSIWAFALAVFPLGAALTGCSNSCVVFVSNPGGGTSGIVASNSSTGCTVATQHAAVHLAVHVTPLCESCSESNQVRSVYLSLRGIALHRIANEGEELSAWQELLPSVQGQPRQFHITAASPHVPTALSIGDRAVIPAGTYDLVRMHFVPNQGAVDDVPGEENACGRVGWNCVRMGDGRILPLVLRGDFVDFRITSKDTEGGFFLVLPESENQLSIELTPVWPVVPSLGEGAGPFPALTASGQRSSEN